MTQEAYRKLIVEGIEQLPPDLLAEIADFVLLIRRKHLNPEAYQEELRQALLQHNLSVLDRNEAAHLEEEFDAYDKRHPVE